MHTEHYLALAVTWILSTLFGWSIGRVKGLGREGLLFGLLLGILGVVVIAVVPAARAPDDEDDPRFLLREQRRRDAALTLLAGFAGVIALALIGVLMFVVPKGPRDEPQPQYEFGIMNSVDNMRTFDAAGISGFTPVSCRYVHDGAETDAKWGYECIFQRRIVAPDTERR